MKNFELKVDGKDYKIDIEKFDGKQAVVNVDGKSYQIDVKKAAEALFSTKPPSSPLTRDESKGAPSGAEPTLAPVAAVPTGGQVIAPMPGLILEIMVSVGETVTAGAPVVKMEAMKMENEIPAPVNGTIKELRVKKGDRVATDQVLLVID